MKRNIVLSVLALLVLSSFKNCGENEKFPEYVDMIFMIPINITPITESLHVGDTLILEANFPDTIKEYHSGAFYKLQNFNFSALINMLELSSNSQYLSQQPGNSHKFTVLSEIGLLEIAGSLGGYLHFCYKNDGYKLRIKLIPKAKSVTCLLFITYYFLNNLRIDHIIDLGNTTDGRKRIPILRGIYFIVNDGDNNFQLLSENCKLALTNYPVPNNIYGERYGTFTFRVVE